MLRNTRIQLIAMVVIGALLGAAGATGGLELFRTAAGLAAANPGSAHRD
jgi:hypothetical protein